MFQTGKEYKTRGGYTLARIYALDGGGAKPIHGATKTGDAGWESADWDADGRYSYAGKETVLDLVGDPIPDYAAFVGQVARMTPYPEDGQPYAEDAVETLNRLIEQAKAMMGPAPETETK